MTNYTLNIHQFLYKMVRTGLSLTEASADTNPANAQIVLMSASYTNQLDPTSVQQVGHSSIFLNAISNRLAAASARSRFLGMAVGMALSQLTEPPGKAMKFDLEEMETEEALWYLNLVKTKDSIGSLEPIGSTLQATRHLPRSRIETKLEPSSRPKDRPNPRSVKVMSIEEIESTDEENAEDDDDDLVPYEKPDADASDSEDDPTLVRRGKPAAPV